MDSEWMRSLRPAIDWILSTDLSSFVLNWGWLWPASESVHFIGLVLLAGTVGMFDLRLLGFAKGVPPVELHRLLRWGVLGFGLSVATGVLFIFGAPDQYFYNSAFHLKVVGLLLMGLNVLFFYKYQFTSVRGLGPADNAPAAAKTHAAVSLALIVFVMACGRMLTFFRPSFIY